MNGKIIGCLAYFQNIYHDEITITFIELQNIYTVLSSQKGNVQHRKKLLFFISLCNMTHNPTFIVISLFSKLCWIDVHWWPKVFRKKSLTFLTQKHLLLSMSVLLHVFHSIGLTLNYQNSLLKANTRFLSTFGNNSFKDWILLRTLPTSECSLVCMRFHKHKCTQSFSGDPGFKHYITTERRENATLESIYF